MTKTLASRRLPLSATFLFALVATALFTLLAPRAFAQTPDPTESPSSESPAVLGILGLSAPDGRGVTVARVVPDSGADEAGLEPGDLITDFEGTKVTSMEDLTTAMDKFKSGDEVTVTYEREGRSETAEVELGTRRANRGDNPFQIPNFDPRFPEDAPEAPRRPDAPNAPDFRTEPSSSVDYRPVLTLFGLLITGALVALIVMLARRDRPAADASVTTAAYVPASAATRADPLDILRMRYAKGEITRDEYLTMSSDLNGSGGAPASESPTQEL
jgi:membrane-associated protease RseP (regulator of RpoE activity)